MWSWAVRGVLAALAAFLVIATVPRSNLSPAQVPTPTSSATEAEARAAGGTSADPVTAAELVLGNASCGRDLVMWRLVRQSGNVMYLVPEFPGAAPPGALMTDREVWFSTSGRPVAYAKAAAAC